MIFLVGGGGGGVEPICDITAELGGKMQFKRVPW